MAETVLVGDVGGTHSRWALFAEALGPVSVVRTRDFTTLKQAVDGRIQGASACGVAVAGPVVNGRVSLTNAQWVATEADLSVPVALVNDLEAVALSVPHLCERDVEWLTSPAALSGTVLCLGIGTGFGGAIWRESGAIAMEPGHDPLHFDAALDRMVTVEEVVSGMAIARMKERGLDVDSTVPDAFLRALTALVERVQPDSVCLMGGVVEARRDLFHCATELGLPVGVIVHPHPALLGAAAAAKRSLAMQ